ncbi:hypothetical protein OPU71_18565 [Niveibacterium sp. 24ML]|uniref:hypothetical protein n=1 Tax=Niveibacterium sp. 24ML TaxID=2985512 RepID=UPI00226EE846|nr:hypothetical protein [Niveibacterium sp. 24ML]MCX9158130.1 hypothetical protein [Niveibacterium sp. 24ML]
MSVRESADVFVDACLRNDAGELLFLSVYGRDTAVLSLFAAFSLPQSGGGYRSLHVKTDEGEVEVLVSQPDRLEKMTARLPKDNLFGNLTHSWLYDPDAVRPDRVNRRSLLLQYNESDEQFAARIWSNVKQLSPVPLMDHWRTALMDGLGDELVRWLDQSAAPPIGCVGGCRVELDERFERMVSIAVASSTLTLEPADMPSDAAARIAQAFEFALSATPELEAEPDAQSVIVLPAGQGLFSPGLVGCTPGIQALAERGVNVQALIIKLLRRHLAGDWGIVSAADARENRAALVQGFRLMSVYLIDESLSEDAEGSDEGEKVWVITEADRSSTTVLLPSEY